MPPGHVAPLRAVLAERPAVWGLGAVLAGSWLVAASSWVVAPIYPVPMTLQTLAVMLVAGLAGARLALAIVITWLAQAALGAPLLADGAGGFTHDNTALNQFFWDSANHRLGIGLTNPE